MAWRSNSRPVSRQRSFWRRVADYMLAALLLGGLILLAARLGDPAPVEVGPGVQGRPVMNDGDSLTFGAVRVRLWGIDAPEYMQECGGHAGSEACGKTARRALSDMIGKATVSCVKQGEDRYGRLLGICSVGQINLNQRTAATGQAVSYGGYQAEEAQARAARLGLWALEFDRPSDWRKAHQGEAENTHVPPVAAGLRGWIDWALKRLFG